jgi:hypothetical protein
LLNLGGGLSVATVRGRSELSPPTLVNETEPNGTTATANSGNTYYGLPNNGLYQMGISGTVSSSTDADYFNIGQLQAGDVLTLTESGSPSGRGTNADTFVRLYRAGTTAIVASDDDSGPGFDALLYRFTITTTDTYYVRAYRANTTNTGTYQLGIWLENSGAAPTTGGTFTAETEPNETTGTANNASNAWRALPYFASAAGTVTAADTDIFSYQFTAGDIVTLQTHSTSGLIPQAALLNSASAAIATEDGTSIVAGGGGFSPIYSYVIPTTGTYYFRVTGASSSTGSYTADIYRSSSDSLTLSPLGQDLYSFNLTAGQTATASVENISGGVLDLSILDSTGAVVATGVSGSTNLDQVIANFFAPTTGTYYLRTTGSPAIDYQVTVVTGGAFDAEPNDSFAAAQQLAASRAALGAISGSDDWYQITIPAGSVLRLTTATPGGGTGEFTNNLDPAIELYDPSNSLLGSDDNSAPDGRNATLMRTVTTPGNYRIRVMPAGGTSGEYVLNVSVVPSAPPRVGGGMINDGAAQRSRVTNLSLDFDRLMTFPANVESAFTLTRNGGGTVTFQATLAYVNGITRVTLSNFSGAETQSGSLADGRYTLTALASQISSGGIALDGNGDGTPGDNFTFGPAQGLFRFYGDSNGDQHVDIADFGFFSSTFNLNSTQTGFLPYFDFNNDGTIDIADFGQFSLRIFTPLP